MEPHNCLIGTADFYNKICQNQTLPLRSHRRDGGRRRSRIVSNTTSSPFASPARELARAEVRRTNRCGKAPWNHSQWRRFH
jgi:hypothetical protein